MKDSRDTANYPLSAAQIAQSVGVNAQTNAHFITVDTYMDNPTYMRAWVQAVRAVGRHVWFRTHVSTWQSANGGTGLTPTEYLAHVQTWITQNPDLFKAGDILDPCPEAENNPYWTATYGTGWTNGYPTTGTRAFNQFLRALSDTTDNALHAAGITGVITGVRSNNSWWATHPGALETATVARLGYVTMDSYPDQYTTDPATAASLRAAELDQVHTAWPGVPIVIGEMGYSNKINVDDATQDAVLKAEFAIMKTRASWLGGINYWVGAGTSNSGGFTHVFAGSNGAWSLRPAGQDLATFYNDMNTTRG